MNAIIIDDESKARKLLRTILEQHCPEVNIVAECEDLPNGVKQIRKLKPEIVFLDIEMPGHSGLELLDFFDEEEVKFNIVFTTAYNHYAIQAFKMSAVDYLMKPIDVEELQAAVAKCRKKTVIDAQASYQVLRDNFSSKPVPKIAVPVSSGMKIFELDQLLYLKADNTYTEIHTLDGKSYVVSRILKNFEEILTPEQGFLRIHKSYIINKNFVVEINKQDGGHVVMKGQIEIPISHDKQALLTENLIIINRQ